MNLEPSEFGGEIRISVDSISLSAGLPGLRARIEGVGSDQLAWTGARRDDLIAWIGSRLRRALPADANMEQNQASIENAVENALEQAPSSAGTFLIEPMDMEFVDLTLQEATSETTGSTRFIEASGRLRVYMDDEGPEAAPVAFSVEFVLVNLDSQQSHTAAVESGTIHPGELARDIRRAFPIPGKGNYRVKAIVKKPEAGLIVAESQGPVLRVVE